MRRIERGAALSDPLPAAQPVRRSVRRVRAAYVEGRTMTNSSNLRSMVCSLVWIHIPATCDPSGLRDIRCRPTASLAGLVSNVTMADGLVKVVAPIDDTPAATAGVIANAFLQDRQ